MRLFGRSQPLREHRLRVLAEIALQVAQRFATGGNVILRQRARIGARISDHLVPLVKRLRDLQRAARGQAEAVVRFALQRRQIVKPRRSLAR